MEPEELSWRDRANCLGVDQEVFFVGVGGKGGSAKAREICSECVVQEICLEYAIVNTERFGIWGGHTERERRKIRREWQTLGWI